MTGHELCPKKVREARREDIAYDQSMGVYTKVPIEECRRVTGREPIGARWVDVDKGKGDPELEKYRSRLVAQQFNTGNDPTMVAATPPVEALKMIISDAATGNEDKCIMVNDVSRAYMYALIREPMYARLCSEGRLPGEEGLCGRLNKAMYGTRPAAQNWQHEFTDVLTQAGFVAGRSNPCLCFHSGRCLRSFVHGDDFVTSGKYSDLCW